MCQTHHCGAVTHGHVPHTIQIVSNTVARERVRCGYKYWVRCGYKYWVRCDTNIVVFCQNVETDLYHIIPPVLPDQPPAEVSICAWC